MKSGWIVHFKDGGKMFFTEEAYKEFEENNDIYTEAEHLEHWFDVRDLVKKNPLGEFRRSLKVSEINRWF